MKYIQITNHLIKDVIDSFIIDDETRKCVDNIVSSMSNSYSEFIYGVLTRHSTGYVKLDSVNCPLSQREVSDLLTKVGSVPIKVETQNIIIADKLDLLYGTDIRSYSEFSKFSPSFYGEIEEEFYDSEFGSNHELFMSSVREVERLVSYIEQLIIVSTNEEIIEDLVVLGLGQMVGFLFILIY